MFRVNGTYLKMNEGDYGDILTFKLIEGTIYRTDDIKFVIEDYKTKEDIVTIECTYVDDNSFEMSLTQEDTNKLSIGNYLWGIIQERDGELVDTLSIDNNLVVERGLKDESNNSDS